MLKRRKTTEGEKEVYLPRLLSSSLTPLSIMQANKKNRKLSFGTLFLLELKRKIFTYVNKYKKKEKNARIII